MQQRQVNKYHCLYPTRPWLFIVSHSILALLPRCLVSCARSALQSLYLDFRRMINMYDFPSHSLNQICEKCTMGGERIVPSKLRILMLLDF